MLVQHVADVRVGAALRYGVITRDGKGEAVTGIVMMLLGANSRDVVSAVGDAWRRFRRSCRRASPSTSSTTAPTSSAARCTRCGMNLAEGVPSSRSCCAVPRARLRGALAVVLGIPAAMAIALFGMHLFGVTGDLMSLGAIDFGFLVDGPIVILEAVIAATAGQSSSARRARARTAKVARKVARRSRSRSRSSCSSTSRCSRSKASRARCSGRWRSPWRARSSARSSTRSSSSRRCSSLRAAGQVARPALARGDHDALRARSCRRSCACAGRSRRRGRLPRRRGVALRPRRRRVRAAHLRGRRGRHHAARAEHLARRGAQARSGGREGARTFPEVAPARP